MKGHDQLIALRRNGLKPTYVWISDYPFCHLDGLTVSVHGDTPELLDLRFLVGTTALVEGPEQSRVDRIALACKKVAKRVIANCDTWAGNRITSTKTIDTEGILQWPN